MEQITQTTISIKPTRDKYLYPSGLPFTKRIDINLDDQLTRITDHKASLILIDGALGSGKTTLAVHLMDYLNKKCNHPEVALEIKDHPQLAQGGAEFTKNLRICHERKLSVLFYDESGDFSRRGSLTKFNKDLNRIFETFRGFQVIIIMALPNFNSLDNSIFDKDIPRILFHLSERYYDYGEFKVFSAKSMNWVRHWFGKLSLGNKYMAYKNTACNLWGHFKDLTPERSEKLDKLSTLSKLKTLRESEISMDGLISYTDICKKIRRSICWVRNEITKYKIKHIRIINRRKYFDESIIELLSEKDK